MKTRGITRRDFLMRSAGTAAALCTGPYLTWDAWAAREDSSLKIAVEFTDHAAAAYVAIDKGFYEAEGISTVTYESYATGAALAGALTQGAIDAAYICLIPAVNAYANGGVPIKVACGTHLYGYGLVAHPEKINSPTDLQKTGIRIGCLAEGTAVDTLMHKTMEKFALDKQLVLSQTKRMSPAKAILAMRAKQLDAAFLPEHWATMAERYGFSMLLTAKDVWPNMIGSVLVVRENVIRKNPDTVRTLVRVTKKATSWMQINPDESARIIARYLSFENDKAILMDALEDKEELRISPDLVGRSMKNLEYATSVDKQAVQEVINNAARLGNIKQPFPADAMLDLQFLEQA